MYVKYDIMLHIYCYHQINMYSFCFW